MKSQVFIIIAVTIGILAGLALVSQRQILQKRAAATDTANLYFSPNTVKIAPGASFNVNVILDTGGSRISGADIIVLFDRNKLLLTAISKPTHNIFRTFAPLTSTGSFDTAKVISNANNTSSGVEFGITAFDWINNSLTGSFTGLMSPVATLTFQARSGTNGQTDTLRFRFGGANVTTDSNVTLFVSDPPEDILLAPSGSLSTVAVGISSSTIPPTFTPTKAPSRTPTPGGIIPTKTPTRAPTRTPTPIAYVNLLKNPGFELDSDKNGYLDNWTKVGYLTRVVTYSSVYPHGGSYFGRIYKNDDTAADVQQTVTGLSAGKNYKFSGFINIPSTSDSFTTYLRIIWRNSGDSNIKTDTITTYNKPTGGWQSFSFTKTAPANTYSALVGIRITNLKANVFIDDFSFR